MANPLRIRLGVHNLSDAQIAAFRSSYQQMMGIADNRGYQYLAGLHGVPSWYCWHHQQNAHSAQQLQLFLPWHRAYLYNWEMAMRDRVPDVTLPWWIGRRVRRAKVASRRSSASLRLTASPMPSPVFGSIYPAPGLRWSIEPPGSRGPQTNFPLKAMSTTRSRGPTGTTLPRRSKTFMTTSTAGFQVIWAWSGQLPSIRSSGRITR